MLRYSHRGRININIIIIIYDVSDGDVTRCQDGHDVFITTIYIGIIYLLSGIHSTTASSRTRQNAKWFCFPFRKEMHIYVPTQVQK